MKILADVIIPTLNRPHTAISAAYLKLLPPWVGGIHLVGPEYANSWPGAINHGLAGVPKGRDVIIMDDDIFLMPDTFAKIEGMYDAADIFGFKLLYPDGRLQHAGGLFVDDKLGHRYWQQEDKGQADSPMYMAHVTTSLIYIKAHVIEKLGGMATDYPGVQFEDVDFCIRALKAGFRLLYLPSAAVHMESASKKHMDRFQITMQKNYLELRRRFFEDKETMKMLCSYPQPMEPGLVGASQ